MVKKNFQARSVSHGGRCVRKASGMVGLDGQSVIQNEYNHGSGAGKAN